MITPIVPPKTRIMESVVDNIKINLLLLLCELDGVVTITSAKQIYYVLVWNETQTNIKQITCLHYSNMPTILNFHNQELAFAYPHISITRLKNSLFQTFGTL
jgi:hypothetical protein